MHVLSARVLSGACIGVGLLGMMSAAYWRLPVAVLLCFGLSALIGLVFWWQDIFDRAFGFSRRQIASVFLSMGTTVVLVGTAAGMLVAWHRLTVETAPIAFFLVGVGTFFLRWYAYRRARFVLVLESDSGTAFTESMFSARLIIPLLYLVMWGYAIWRMWAARSSAVLVTPWQALPEGVLWLIGGTTMLLGIMIFSHFRTKTVLLFCILQACLVHGYLPLSHVLPWGGDVWRHAAMEERIVAGEYIRPVLVGPIVDMTTVGSVNIPSVFLSPNKYAYAQLWGMTVLAHLFTHAGILVINVWLAPLLWTLFVPVLLFFLGKVVFGSARAGLTLAWLSGLSFPLQALGGLTLPVSLGLVSWLLALLLWFSYLRSGDRRQLLVAFIVSLLLTFSYLLLVILLWVPVLFALCIREGFLTGTLSRGPRTMILVFIATVSACILPVVEFVGKTVSMPDHIDWARSFITWVGQWSGWYYASAIRPHDITSGNFLWNHTPVASFVSSPFTDLRYHVIVVTALLFFTVAMSVYHLFTRGDERMKVLLLSLTSMVFGSYIIGWYILTGERLLIRRLDGAFAYVLFFLVVLAISHLSVTRFTKSTQQVLVCVVIFLLSWFGTTTLASGPDLRVVSADEYDGARMIWENERESTSFCVIGDTWPLLALEYQSHGKIVGGGFPIDRQFGQPERIELLQAMKTAPTSTIRTAHTVTGADHCWFWEEGLRPVQK